MSKEILELDISNDNSKEYKVEAIWDSAVYANKLESGHLQGLYYLVTKKGYPKEENTWVSLSAVQNLKKLISSFHKNYLKKPTANSPPINSAPPIDRPTIKPTIKYKQGWPANSVSKRAKKKWIKLAYVPVNLNSKITATLKLRDFITVIKRYTPNFELQS